MDFTENSCRAFVDALASKQPVPGGGGASALVGAVGVALGSMVASLTIGKKKYADVQEEIVRIAAEAEGLQNELLSLVTEDATAFEPLAAAYGLPTETDEQRARKATVMEDALRLACTAPVAILESCCKAVTLIERLSQIGSAIALSDAGCAAACCRAALTGGALNIYINAKSMTDRAYAAALTEKVDAMLHTFVPLCDEVYASVEERLRRQEG